jgi:hypothetical protein
MHGAEMLEHVKSLIAGLAPYESEKGEDGKLRLVPRPGGDWDRFTELLSIATAMVGTLAPYQSPRLAAIKVEGPDKPVEYHHKHLHVGMDLRELASAYQERVKAIAHVVEG